MIDRGKRSVLGVGINVIDYDGAIARVLLAARTGAALNVSALAVHGVMTGFLDPVHRFRLNRLSLVTPDGQPVRWALKWLYGEKLPDRVYGPNMMLEICRAAAEDGLPIYLYGSGQTVLDNLSRNLKQQIPKLIIAGSAASRFRTVSDTESTKILNDIQATGAKIVFVGLGCPRQEVFAYENAEALSCPVIGVGAAFDFHAGNQPQAPRWLQDCGLEWLFRLRHEPKRLWRRYLYLNPLFLWNIALQWLLPARFDEKNDPAPATRQNFA